MLEECGEIVGLDIYTDEGVFVGKVDAIAFDTDSRSVGSLIVERPNPAVAEDGVILGIPYSWVSAVGDVVSIPVETKKFGRIAAGIEEPVFDSHQGNAPVHGSGVKV